ncbi:MAG: hypothetical protein ACOH2R_17445 [Pseudomonas sp.]
MNSSDIRAHLRKGDQAITILETLGYVYTTEKVSQRPIWEAPVDPQDALKEALQDLIDQGVKEGVAKAHEALRKDDSKGPNWHLVEPMVGKLFRVRQENIPVMHPLRDYGQAHFLGVNYRADEIQYVRTPKYTGYSVGFKFRKRPFSTFETVWLPLSCAAFQ